MGCDRHNRRRWSIDGWLWYCLQSSEQEETEVECEQSRAMLVVGLPARAAVGAGGLFGLADRSARGDIRSSPLRRHNLQNGLTAGIIVSHARS